MKKKKGITIVIIIIVFIILSLNIVFFGFIDIIIINATKLYKDQVKVKYKIVIINHEVERVEKAYVYENKETAQNKYEEYQEINTYLPELDKKHPVLKGKQIIINMTEPEFLEEMQINYEYATEDIEKVFSNNEFKVQTYLNYNRINDINKREIQQEISI